MSLKHLLTYLFFPLCIAAQAQQFGWSQQLGGLNLDEANFVIPTPDGHLLTIGKFQDSIDIEPGPGVSLLENPNIGQAATFIQKTDADGHLVWAGQLGAITASASICQVKGACLDPSGNLLLSGNYTGAIDFDPGPGVFQMNGPGAFVAKYSSSGSLIWFDNFSGDILGSHLVSAPDGAIYWSCNFRSAVDIDPGSQNIGIFTPTSAECILKLKADGALQWFRKWDVGINFSIASLNIALDGSLIFTGVYNGQFDMDPGAGDATIASLPNTIDAFICQFTSGGVFQWSKQINGQSVSIAGLGGVEVDQNGNIILGINLQGTKDLDPGPGVFNLTGNFDDIVLMKLDALGDFLWARQITGTKDQRVGDICIDELGDIYVTGDFNETADFDPGLAEAILDTENYFRSGYVLKLDFLGNFQWVKGIRGECTGFSIAVSPNHRVYIGGNFSGALFFNPENPSASYTAMSGKDAFVLRFNQPHHYSGKVFYDINGNGALESGEPGLMLIPVQARGLDQYATTNLNGDFHFYDNLAGDTIVALTPWAGVTIQPAFVVPDSTQAPMLFAASLPNGGNLSDVCIAATELTPFRPGFQTIVNIQVSNVGLTVLQNIPVKLRIVRPDDPNLLIYQTANLQPVIQNPDYYEWTLGVLAPGQKVDIQVLFTASVAIGLNTSILLSTSVILDDDVNPFNNGSRIETVTIGSFDPNDKQVTPPAVALASIDTTNLRYVIRFQNTGTYPADFVVIRDTLPAELDLSTLKVLAASHPFSWRLFGPRVLEFRFDPIHLPDSTSNEPESHGFVHFTAKAKAGQSLGTVIHNRASIYFDYNEPVITNYADMRVGTAVNIQTPESILKFELMPNPATAGSSVLLNLTEAQNTAVQVRIFDGAGRNIRMLEMDAGEQQINLSGLPAGAYFVQLRAGGRMGGSALIVK